MKIFYLLAMLMGCVVINAQIQWPEINGGVRVLDEVGKPITNAHVSVWFDSMRTSNVFDGTKTDSVWGRSDASGQFSVTHSALGEFGVGVQEEGYYISRKKVALGKHKDGKWIPWHQVTDLTVRKKESPIPMFAKKLERTEIPATNSPVGYDLMAGDWVSPHGRGVVSDIVFKLQCEIRGKFDLSWQLSITTPGDGNGLRAILHSEVTPESELHFPRTAPLDGYALNDMFFAFNRSAGSRWETNSTSATNFFFRVRTKYHEINQLKSALYGKLHGPIRVNVQGTKTAKLYFTYYLNPTPLDRNMEFDPKKNLFKGLRFDEEVREP